MTIKKALDAYDRNEESTTGPAGTQGDDELASSLRAFSEAMERSPANVKLKEI